MTASSSALAVVERLYQAMNAHDLEAFLACFADNYDSKQPVRPSRAFVGIDRVRKNWTPVFEGVRDLQAELVSATVDGSTVWAESHWHGTWADGGVYDMKGVLILGIEDDQIVWGRLYMAPTET